MLHRWKDGPGFKTGLSMPLEDTNIFEIGATWPEKIERKGCGIPFSLKWYKTCNNQNPLHCAAPDQPPKQETHGGELVPNNIVWHPNSTLKYLAENIVDERIDNEQHHGSYSNKSKCPCYTKWHLSCHASVLTLRHQCLSSTSVLVGLGGCFNYIIDSLLYKNLKITETRNYFCQHLSPKNVILRWSKKISMCF